MGAPGLDHFARLSVRVGSPVELEASARGSRRLIPILGGTISGRDFTGRILPLGYDDQLIRTDRVADLHAEYAIEFGDGSRAMVTNVGVRVADAEVTAALLRDEPVPAERVYFRTTPRIACGADRWAWLSEVVFLGCGMRRPGVVDMDFYIVR